MTRWRIPGAGACFRGQGAATRWSLATRRGIRKDTAWPEERVYHALGPPAERMPSPKTGVQTGSRPSAAEGGGAPAPALSPS